MGINSHEPGRANNLPTFTRASAVAAWWDNLPYFGSWPKPTLVGGLVLNGGIQAAGGAALLFFGLRYADGSLTVTGAIVLAIAALVGLIALVATVRARRRRDATSVAAAGAAAQDLVPPKYRR